MKNSFVADGALLLVALCWGLNFVVEKHVLLTMTPLMYLGLRFFLSAAIVIIIFHKRLKTLTIEDIKAGLVIGLFMLLGFLTQTVGLVYTTPGKSGFITGSNVVMVPFFAYLLTKRLPGPGQLVGAVVTFCGLGMVSLGDELTISYGDMLTLLCAVCFALQIALTDHYAKKADPVNIAIIQLALSGIVTMGAAAMQGPITLEFGNMEIWAGILFGVIFCTAGALIVQNVAQRYTSSTHAAVILCTESVFAGLFSFLFGHEVLTFKAVTGFLLILAGVLITELVPQKTQERIEQSVDAVL